MGIPREALVVANRQRSAAHKISAPPGGVRGANESNRNGAQQMRKPRILVSCPGGRCCRRATDGPACVLRDPKRGDHGFDPARRSPSRTRGPASSSRYRRASPAWWSRIVGGARHCVDGRVHKTYAARGFAQHTMITLTAHPRSRCESASRIALRRTRDSPSDRAVMGLEADTGGPARLLSGLHNASAASCVVYSERRQLRGAFEQR